MSTYHTSVLLQEAVDALHVRKDEWYIDATLGGGGHTGLIVERGGLVLGIDTDEEALAHVRENFKYQITNDTLRITKGNFRDIDKLASEAGIESVSGILFDLGVSSHQLDTPERGFSFQKEGPLDMRMGRDLGVMAADLVNALSKGELYELFTKLGQEPYARNISDRIVSARRIKPIATTSELAELIRGKNRTFTKIDPATKVFQALRIAVNDELHGLEEALPKALSLLKPGGRVVIISFHSLEDRIVKNAFKEFEQKDLGVIVTQKPIAPGRWEQEANRRSRSAKMRVFEKSI